MDEAFPKSIVDVSNIRITGINMEESIKETFTDQELKQFAEDARMEAHSEAVAISSISVEQAIAISKMETRLKDLRKASEEVKKNMLMRIRKGEEKIEIMEKQLREQSEDVYKLSSHNEAFNIVTFPIRVPLDITMNIIEKEQKVISEAYTFFDTINTNDDGDFSVRDAMSSAYMMQFPNCTKETIEKHVATGVRTV